MADALSISTVIDQVIDFTVPILKIAKTPFAYYMKHRETKAREILLEEITNAKIDPLHAAINDELIGVIYTYMQCAQKGMARMNLNLLAQAIAGEMHRDGIYPDKFQKYINTLSSLTRDEVFFLGNYLRVHKKLAEEAEKNNTGFLNNISVNAWNQCVEEMVPHHFKSKPHLDLIMYRLLGLGFIHPAGAVLGGGIGTPNFTILLHEMAEVVDFEHAHTKYPEY